ncbi:MAG: SpoIIE family protein phosphatase [Bacteroidia bacterium]|nr:SpoIIE family protein phosphatase [Bacteroidia bacterium]
MKLKIYITFLIVLSCKLIAGSLPDSLINHLDFTKIKHGHVNITLDGRSHDNTGINLNWLYFAYDYKDAKNNSLTDTGFSVITETKLELDDDENGVQFNGIAWYKLYFRINLKNVKKIQSFFISQIGASEFYLDGKLLQKVGQISDNGETKEAVYVNEKIIRYFLEDTLVHVLAIRYSSPDYSSSYNYKEREVGPEVIFSGPEENVSRTDMFDLIYSITNMLAAFFFALFCIHLVIYLFYREKTFNLYYALFLLFLSLSFFEFYFVNYIESAETYLWVSNIDGIFFPACCFFLVTLLNKLLNEKRTKHYIFLCCMMIALVIDLLFFRRISGMLTTSIVFYTYFNTLAHSIVGIKRKIPSSKFLGWGILSFTISIILLIIVSVLISSVLSGIGGDLVTFILGLLATVCVLSIPLSMTAYLAFDFSRTNKDLSNQLKANEELNKKSLEQEKEKQEILENQNKVLESQVAERTKEIGEQNKVLEHQKKEITDSINYAKRIQQALLPELESIKVALPNSFVYYVPKDIVSGDFYFFNAFSKKEDHPGRKESSEEAGLFIAAADCTGHGVPGALMSMIVHEKLENATKYHGEPSEILHSINKQVKDALKQHQTDASRDGCDIALCKIQGNTLSYAGAYRPLYLFYKNGEFKEIKATKTAIAGLTPYDQKFEQHQFDTTELKAVYMFSDGFADQFGGQKSKKLTTKKFKELLHTIVNLPINEQNSQLEAFFTNWRGNVEQIDDVLVIGITF